MFKKVKGMLAVILTIAVVSGCSLPGLGGNDSNNNVRQTLKVMHYDEGSFYQEYGMLYSALNDNVDIEVLNTNQIYNRMSQDEEFSYEELFIKFVEENQPDVIITDSYYMPQLIEKSMLYDLDSYVNQDDYDLAGIGTAVVEYMKELGNGVMYGIPTSISSQALFYNKDIFDEYGVPYPTDNMTWTEVINLANMFPTEGEYPDRVYGLKYSYTSSLSDLIQQMAGNQGLRQYDPETLTMTIDTPAWRDLIEGAIKLYESKALYTDQERMNYQPTDYSNFDYNSLEPILGGIVAMAFEYSYYLSELKNAKNYAMNPDILTENWDLVTAPVGQNGNNASNSTYYGNIMAINANSTNLEAAWDFVSYVTGDDYARVKSFTSYGNLPIRMKYALKDETKNVQAFYTSKPMVDEMIYNSDIEIPQRFQYEFYQLFYEELMKLETGEASVDEVLSTLQLKGEELLNSEIMTDEELQDYINDLYGNYYNEPREFVDEVSTEAVEVIVE